MKLLFTLLSCSAALSINWPGNVDQNVLADQTVQSDVSPASIVDSNQLQSLITEDALRERAEALFEIAGHSNKTFGHPTRVIGSPGHWKTIGYIKKELSKLGGFYKVRTQKFGALYGEIFSYNATINGVVPKTLGPMDMSPETPGRKPVTGPLLAVENQGCSLEDFPKDTAGSVLLIQRGNCSFGDKAINAAKLGAVAAIVYNNEAGEVRGTLGVPPKGSSVAPSVCLSQDEGEEYVTRVQAGEQLTASVYVDSLVGTVKTLNVIAESVQGDPDNVVMLGAHSDSVAAGPGINDDGSGTISLLEVAKQLTKFKLNNRVRFAWWAAEEEGLLGSTYYAEHLTPEENIKIRLFMDYDMMASPNYEYEVYDANNKANPAGSEELKNLYIDYYTSHGLNYTLVPLDGRSDYVGFIDNHIPGGGIAAGAEKKNVFNGKVLDECYHQYCDNLDNLAYDAFIVNTRLIAHSVATYAKSFKGFPKRSLTASTESVGSSFKYRGSHLIM